MGTDIPEPAEIMAVDPDVAFAPRAEVEKGVARFLQTKCCAMKCGRISGLFSELQMFEVLFVERKVEHGPVTDLQCD